MAGLLMWGIGLLLGGLGGLRLIYPAWLRWRHGRKAPGIQLLEHVDIGGIPQSILIRGTSEDHPLLLFVHGGPGSPMMPFLHGFQYPWEEEFTVVQWDQRLAGKTFFQSSPEKSLEAMDFERSVQDGLEVVEYLLRTFNREKIFLVGHSWGTVLASAMAQKSPHYFYAYVGMGQLVDNQAAEIIGYGAALAYAASKKRHKDAAQLKKLEPGQTVPPPGRGRRVRQYLAKYGMVEDISLRLVFYAITSPVYSTKDLGYLLDAGRFSFHQPLYTFLKEFKLSQLGTRYEVPIFYFMGSSDYQTPYPLAKSFFEEIQAPMKKFYSFEGAGHLPMLDDPDQVFQALKDVKKRCGKIE